MRAQGAAVYVPEKEALIWKIKSFPGGREFLLRCKFGLPSVAAEEEAHGRMPPMRVSFEIPYFTVSGIQARHGLTVQQAARSRPSVACTPAALSHCMTSPARGLRFPFAWFDVCLPLVFERALASFHAAMR